jgi:hypothetical protein
VYSVGAIPYGKLFTCRVDQVSEASMCCSHNFFLRIDVYNVKFYVLTAVVTKSSVLWDVVDFLRATRRYIPEDRTLDVYKFTNMKR